MSWGWFPMLFQVAATCPSSGLVSSSGTHMTVFVALFVVLATERSVSRPPGPSELLEAAPPVTSFEVKLGSGVEFQLGDLAVAARRI